MGGSVGQSVSQSSFANSTDRLLIWQLFFSCLPETRNDSLMSHLIVGKLSSVCWESCLVSVLFLSVHGKFKWPGASCLATTFFMSRGEDRQHCHLSICTETSRFVFGKPSELFSFFSEFLNCGWVGLKSPKMFCENTCHVYMTYLAMLSILFLHVLEKKKKR